MNIRYFGSTDTWLDENEEKLMLRTWGRQEKGMRFLVFKEGDDLHLVLADGQISAHSHRRISMQVLRKQSEWSFIAGGYISKSKGTRYDSETCKEQYGFDRPKDSDEQTRLLAEIQKALEENGMMF